MIRKLIFITIFINIFIWIGFIGGTILTQLADSSKKSDSELVSISSSFDGLMHSFVKSVSKDTASYRVLSDLQTVSFKKLHTLTGTNIANFNKTDKLIDTETLREQILTILGSEQEKYGIYLYDLKRDNEVSINADIIFPPMSISKLPVGIMTLKAVDEGKFKLDDYFEFDNQSWADPTNVLKRSFIGTSFSIADYVRFLLVDSDNSSIRKLESLLGGYELLNEKVKAELGVEHFFRNPHDATAKDVGRVFKGIYNQEYLSFEMNKYLVELLQNTHPILQDGIPVGVPAPYKYEIAHKTGQGSSDIGYIWEDAALVFGEKTDYILVVLNDRIDIPVARYKIQRISELVWNTLN